MNRLDEVMKDLESRDSNGRLICRLELNIGNGGWIGKEDTGTESDNHRWLER